MNLLANTKERKKFEIRAAIARLESEVFRLRELEAIVDVDPNIPNFEYDPDLDFYNLLCAGEGCKSCVRTDGGDDYLVHLSGLRYVKQILCKECQRTPEEREALRIDREARKISNNTALLRKLVAVHGSDIDLMLEAAKDPSKDPIAILKSKIEK